MMFMSLSTKSVDTDYEKVTSSPDKFANHVKVNVARNSTLSSASILSMASIQNQRAIASSFPNSFRSIRKRDCDLRLNPMFLPRASSI